VLANCSPARWEKRNRDKRGRGTDEVVEEERGTRMKKEAERKRLGILFIKQLPKGKRESSLPLAPVALRGSKLDNSEWG
jgi:hypothetical protein